MKEISKNTQEKIRVEKRKYKGREFVDVRTYYLDDSGEWKPSPKGITFKVELLEDIIEALESERTRRPLDGSSLPPGAIKIPAEFCHDFPLDGSSLPPGT